jgi:nucleoid-associated protein YgaU
MRARILIATLAVALVAAPAASTAVSRHPQVAGLQAALRAHGLYRGAIDGIRGPLTIRAVREFQRAHRLPATGHVGRRTRSALGALGRHLYGTRILMRGAVGWDVAVLQYLLVRRGIVVRVNGHFDGRTVRGVLRLQRRAHIARDGIVGPGTRKALARAHPAVRHVRHGRRTGTYVVRTGDTLTAIASHYGTTVSRIARLNRIDPSHWLIAGARIRVPRGSHPAGSSRVPARTMSIASVRTLLDRWAARYGVDSRLVRGLAWMESGYNNRLVSSTGARGIMQIEPYTWTFVQAMLIGHPVGHGPNGNIHVGVAYLHHLLADFHGNTRLALAGWYQGEGAVRERGLYHETRRFVRVVLSLAARM